jgi:hypothetical protein
LAKLSLTDHRLNIFHALYYGPIRKICGVFLRWVAEGGIWSQNGSTLAIFGASLLPRIWQFLALIDHLVAQPLTDLRGKPQSEGERVTRLELATSTLARLHSTN